MSNFVDEVSFCARGGDGGAGCASFRREAHTPNGGPDGGDGGSGGDVWLVADRNVASLLAFRDHPHRIADSGTHGSGSRRHGARGGDLIVPVPEGTVVRERDGEILADLVNHGDRWLAAAGGAGGRGNPRFASGRLRAPAFAEQGEKGEERWMQLELKLMADAALVGFPNVGKSTIISAISNAKPKVADYPFTTLVPNLGVVRMDDDFEMVVADIPGLIEGAAEGRGLGDRFLRHIERSRALVLVLDIGDPHGPTVEEQESTLLAELEAYHPDLLERPRVRVASRCDVAPEGAAEGFDGVVVSAVTRQGIPQLLGAIRDAVSRAREEFEAPEAYVVHRPVPEGVRIVRHDDASFEVLGREAARAVALSDLTDGDALDHAHRRLAELGVDRALARAGARHGDTVVIGDLSFEFESENEFVLADDDEDDRRR